MNPLFASDFNHSLADLMNGALISMHGALFLASGGLFSTRAMRDLMESALILA